jgi:hypothetical protein
MGGWEEISAWFSFGSDMAVFSVNMLVDLQMFQVAEQVSQVKGVKKVLVADDAVFKGFLPGTMCFCGHKIEFVSFFCL